MRMSVMGTRSGAPLKLVAAAATAALLVVPLQAAAQGPQRTALLALTDGASLAQLADSVVALGGRVVASLDVADALLVEIPADAAVPAGATEVPDIPMRVNGAAVATAAAIGAAPTYRSTIGAPDDPELGAGITVALVDTGVDPSAAGLGEVTHVAVPGVDDTGDGYGHGTHLAGIIAGRGMYPGVVPGATLLDVKVADNAGETSLSIVLAGLQEVAERDVDVVNVSLSSGAPLPPGADPLSRALERLWGMGTTVVVAAGNDGPDEIGSPGNHPVLLTAGALDESGTAARDDDVVAPFSSRGTKLAKGKPDLAAPGVSIVSAAAPGSLASESARWTQDGYIPGSGTSMSAAVVAGAAAAVLAGNPDLRPNGVKSLLVTTTYRSAALEAADGAGAGGLDLAAALAQAADAPLDVAPDRGPKPTEDWGPAEGDADAWAAFAAAWESGDKDAVRAAWAGLRWQTKQWASRAWMVAVLADSLGLSAKDFQARSWAARSWAFDGWLARSWAARSWAARSWAFDEWVARSWAARSWAARSWAARSWADDEWLARSWAARSWAARSWAARSWAARSWAARSWADDEWAARSWAARSWATSTWGARSWAARSWASTPVAGDSPWTQKARSWA